MSLRICLTGVVKVDKLIRLYYWACMRVVYVWALHVCVSLFVCRWIQLAVGGWRQPTQLCS